MVSLFQRYSAQIIPTVKLFSSMTWMRLTGTRPASAAQHMLTKERTAVNIVEIRLEPYVI